VAEAHLLLLKGHSTTDEDHETVETSTTNQLGGEILPEILEAHQTLLKILAVAVAGLSLMQAVEAVAVALGVAMGTLLEAVTVPRGVDTAEEVEALGASHLRLL